jgi:hypothetical protein
LPKNGLPDGPSTVVSIPIVMISLSMARLLARETRQSLSSGEYERLYNFTDFRDAVMHGRILFPAYQNFKERSSMISQIGELIEELHSRGGNPVHPRSDCLPFSDAQTRSVSEPCQEPRV